MRILSKLNLKPELSNMSFMSNFQLGWFFLGLILLGTLIPPHFDFTTTPSLRYTMFFFIPMENGTYKKGDYVYLTLNSKYINDGKDFKATKEVGCTEGDDIKVQGMDYYCNQRFLATAKEFSLKGEKIERFHFSGKVPKGKIFLVGHTKDSFDSRYFGFVGEQDVQARSLPIF